MSHLLGKNSRVLWILEIVVICALAVSILVYHIYGYYYGCHPGFDFLIHQESLNALSTLKSFNPFVFCQNINIFNDHFDPIIFTGILFVKLFQGNIVGHLLFQSFWYWAMLLFVFFTSKGNRKACMFSLFMVVLSGGLLAGLTFPLHPMTWSMLPLVMLCYCLRKQNRIGIVLLSCFLCLFKETFPYASLFLGLWILFRKQYKTAIPIIIFAGAYLLFINFFREELIGPMFPYKDVYLDPLKENIIDRIIFLFKTLDYKSWFYLLYPFVIPLFLLVKKEVWGSKWWEHDAIIPALIYLIPFVGIHFLSNIMLKWNQVTFTSIFLGLIVFSSIPAMLLEKKKLAVLVIVVMILGSSRYYTRIFKLLIFNKGGSCKIVAPARKSLVKAREIVKNIEKGKVIVATSGFIPWSNEVGKVILPAGGNSEKPIDIDYLILQRNGAGYTLPWDGARVEMTIKFCMGVERIIEDDFIFLAKGPFSKQCLDYIGYQWNTRVF